MDRAHERGAALLAVLAMVVLLAGFASLGLARLRAATDRMIAAEARSEVQLLAHAGTGIAVEIVNRLKTQSVRRPGTLAEAMVIPIGDGRVELRFADGNCFNLNSLAAAPAPPGSMTPAQPAARPEDLSRLLTAAGIPGLEAGQLAQATAARLAATGQMWADGTEWAAVPGVTAQHWALAGRFLCAMPDRGISTLNVNSLTREMAPLLAGLGLSSDAARRALALRPEGGWGTANGFWEQAFPSGAPEGEMSDRVGTSSRWMRLSVIAETPQARVERELVIDSIRQPAQVVSSRWRAVEVTA